MLIEEQVQLSLHTTFRLGGEARFLARVGNLEDLAETLVWARERHLRTMVLGGGSNCLVSDEGFDGIIIKIESRGIAFAEEGGKIVCTAAAGEVWDSLVAEATGRGLWGVENLSGIPGTVGGAPVQNIGAYGSELSDSLVWVEVFDTTLSQVVRFSKEGCEFGYRSSVFKKHPGRYVVLHAALALSPMGSAKLTYKDLKEHFKDGAPDTPQEVREAVLAIRARKFPDLTKEGTAGSFFLNPIVSTKKAQELKARYPQLPQFQSEGGVKISLAWLLDHVLNVKGMSVGGARLFEKQPIVVVADESATTRDVHALADAIVARVEETFAITLEKEVQVVA